jgi:hypothetical protein
MCPKRHRPSSWASVMRVRKLPPIFGATIMGNAGSANPNLVEVVEAVGEWFVRVVENGKEHTSSFELESYALAFAEGQRLRLNLDRFVRL